MELLVDVLTVKLCAFGCKCCVIHFTRRPRSRKRRSSCKDRVFPVERAKQQVRSSRWPENSPTSPSLSLAFTTTLSSHALCHGRVTYL
ncbi:hypothetical protein P153DRAFT_159083 [Dothidotthia symphoricarpi CBS 119687]|uniref:Uncharacterized protein n=1 Tax=Dothidotthia symphoricarpi CBS 119687 TaxID=1392245 RepID=A0A6A6ARE1_9PLEO|nr:uncharacterized protein P153DRAFT_159083 [Dothidotthia symphoricarpi CBS 119687]KAF2133555.1 hypothetical protein P153DRAFT_159083 [Dothidotthia symphoricarpi CBS 119687]